MRNHGILGGKVEAAESVNSCSSRPMNSTTPWWFLRNQREASVPLNSSLCKPYKALVQEKNENKRVSECPRQAFDPLTCCFLESSRLVSCSMVSNGYTDSVMGRAESCLRAVFGLLCDLHHRHSPPCSSTEGGTPSLYEAAVPALR